MKYRNSKFKKGFTIIESMIAIAILVIGILGASAFRYHASLSARRTDLHSTSARIAMLLCEGWTGVGGAVSFNPINTLVPDVNISAGLGPTKPDEFSPLGSYRILLEGNDYYATMSYKNIAADLRALNVIVAWDQFGNGTGLFTKTNKLYRLTTYVENPN